MAPRLRPRLLAALRRPVFVIEAPGKRRKVEESLRALGVAEPVVVATKGHLMGSPASLRPLAITPELRETARGPRNPEIVHYVAERMRGAEVVVLTDPDAEGHVIATDIGRLAGQAGATALVRALPHGLDEVSLAHSLEHYTPLQALAAVPGRARALLDRLIGGVFTKQDVSVGRIASPLLALAVERHMPAGEVVLRIPAASGPDFIAVHPVRNQAEAQRLLAAAAQCRPQPATPAPAPAPLHMGELMRDAWRTRGLSPERTAAVMQDLYQTGKMSYPRSAVTAVGDHAKALAAAAASSAGLRFDSRRLAELPADYNHEAPHPLVSVDIRLDVSHLDDHQAVLTLAAKQLARAGQLAPTELPALLPEPLASIPFRRHPRVPTWLADEQRPTGYHPYPPAMGALAAMLEHGLGRPSTWAEHATRFGERELVGADMVPTPKAWRWHAETPAVLHSPDTAKAMEWVLDHWTEVVETDLRRRGLLPPGASLSDCSSLSVEDAAAIVARAALDTLPPALVNQVLRAAEAGKTASPTAPAQPEHSYSSEPRPKSEENRPVMASMPSRPDPVFPTGS